MTAQDFGSDTGQPWGSGSPILFFFKSRFEKISSAFETSFVTDFGYRIHSPFSIYSRVEWFSEHPRKLHHQHEPLSRRGGRDHYRGQLRLRGVMK